MVFQDANLLPWLTVEDNIALPLAVKGQSRDMRRARARGLARLVGLAGFESHLPSQLSGGMRQRAALARALCRQPDLLLLDEPFGALDAITRDAMNAELQHLWMLHPCSAILVAHSIREALFLADRIVVLAPRPGRIAASLDVPFSRPRSFAIESTSAFQSLATQLRGVLGGR